MLPYNHKPVHYDDVKILFIGSLLLAVYKKLIGDSIWLIGGSVWLIGGRV